MRAVIQRVSEASVYVNGEKVSSVSKGIMVLIGIEEADNNEDLEWLSGKIVNLRIFNDEEGVMNISVKESNGDILLVSQFTLHASTKKGNRPSYINSAKPETAKPLFDKFVQQVKVDSGKSPSTGVFGADMKVALINDGPVTIIIDTKNRI